MQSLRLPYVIIGLVMLFIFHCQIQAQEKQPAPAEVLKLIDTIKPNEVYLFEGQSRSTWNTISTRFRKAVPQNDKDKIADIQNKLFAFLKRCPKYIEITFKNGT